MSTASGQATCHSVSMIKQHAEQGERRADRQVDAAGDDDQAETEAEDSERADQAGRVLQVRGDMNRGLSAVTMAHKTTSNRRCRELFFHVEGILSLPRHQPATAA